MADARVERRLAAILAADVAGYSRLMGVDEEGTLAALKTLRRELIDPRIGEHHGRIVKTTGDGALIEFASAVDAVRCAIEIQRAMAERNAARPEDRRIEFRIGINVGDIIIDDSDIFGDGVNIAARLEGIAEPGGVCMSDDAYRQVRGKIEKACDDMGLQVLKNIAEPMRAWRVKLGDQNAATAQPGLPVRQTPSLALPDKPSIAVLPFQNMSGDPEQEYFVDGMVEEIITALSPHPLAVRHRPQFELHLQGPSRRREAGRARTRRALCARRLGAQGRRPGAHHRAVDRRSNRRASVGRPLRRLARRCLRASGQGGVERRRRHRAGVAGRRDRPFGRSPDRRSDRLRPLSARLCDGLVVGAANPRGAPSYGAGDRARSALRTGTRLGRALLSSAAY